MGGGGRHRASGTPFKGAPELPFYWLASAARRPSQTRQLMAFLRARRPRPFQYSAISLLLAATTCSCTLYGWTYGDETAVPDPGLKANGGADAGTWADAGGAAAGGSGERDAGSGGNGPGADALVVAPTLTDPEATANALRLMHFLTDSYGHTILSGQQELEYVETVLAITGKEPAVLGLDLMDYSPSRVERGASSNAAAEAIEWWQSRGGIVTVAWHWNAPSQLIDQPGQEWWRGFYTSATTFDLAAAMSDETSVEYQQILRDIDAIAGPLKELSDAGVPVLFRPLHEASGAWFWWGARGPGPYLALWNLLRERLPSLHGLHNLIWVWNGQNPQWYPGDATVDVLSEDIYGPRRDYGPQLARFQTATAYSTQPKLVALSENGALPDPDRLISSGAAWSWFCLWSGTEFVVDETWNEDSIKREFYAHEYVTTLDELPDLASYPLP